MYRNCQKCSGLMYGPNYPAWQNNCNRCEMETVKDNAHAEELAKAKSQPVSSGPIVDSQSVAEIENEEIRAELADLRAKLAAAEANGEQYRKNWKSLQDLTGEECLDRARYAVKVWKESAEQLAAATERAEKAEFRARHLEMTNVVPMQNAINDAVRAQEAAEEKFRQAQQDGYFGRLAAETANERDAAIARAEAAEAERDALRAKAETYDELKDGLPPDWPCQYGETGVSILDDVNDLIASHSALARQNAALRAALEVFGNGSVIEAIEREDFSVMKERIVDWFGPSDFKKAKSALALTPPAGGEAGKDSARLDHLIDRKLLSCDVFEDAAEMCIKAGCEDPHNDRRWVRAAIDRSEEEGRC